LIPKRQLFLLIFLPSVLVLLVGLALVQDKNRRQSEGQFEDLLKTSWSLALLVYDQGLMNSPETQEKARAMTKDLGFRLTLITDDGQVTFDSEVNGSLDSHKDRPEFKAALLGAPIFVTRLSETTGKNYMYYAQRAAPRVILRVSGPLTYFDNEVSAFFRQAFFGVLGLSALVALFSFWVSRGIAKVYQDLSLAVAAAKGGEDQLPTFKNPQLDEALYSLSLATRELKGNKEEIESLNARLEYILSRINEGVIFLDGQKILYRNRRAEEILNCPIPDSTAKIDKKEILSVFASVKNPQFNHIKIGERVVFFDHTREDDRLLVIFHDQTEKEKYSTFKSDLVGNISHELKTPLALVLGAAEVILKDKAMPRSYLEKFLGTLYRNAQRLNSLLDDLILLHQLESRPEALAEESDLGEILKEIKEMVEPGDKELTWEADEGIVFFHSAHIISVLTNLVNNALKYSKGPKIQVEVRRKDHFLEIAVADSGPVIPEGERERIFERFYSLSRSRCRDRSGSGLGLAIVKHIARLYHGQVKISDNDLGGNTFWVLLTSPTAF
jgi:two-component system phosphate regulon sensor histidine kinase PhoR